MKKPNETKAYLFTKIIQIIILLLFGITFLLQSQMQIPAYAQENDDDTESIVSYKGLIEIDNIINTYKEQDTADANKKNELRHRMKFRLGTDTFHFFMQNNLYILSNAANENVAKDYTYAEKTDVKRNLLITSKSMEANFNELYLHWQTNYFRMRLGNQMHAWGFTDVIRPTSFINPYDLREFLFKDDDETRMGVPSFSWLFFIGKGSLEFVFVPIHVPQLSTTKDTFWEPNYAGEQNIYKVQLDEAEGMDFEPANYAYAGRLTGSIGSIDFGLNYYHGPDRQPMLYPYDLKGVTNKPFVVLVEQKYDLIDSIGFGFTTNLDKLVLQGEVAYTPNKKGVIIPETYDNNSLPFETQESPQIAYSVGLNYFVPLNRLFSGHEGDSVLSIEWSQAKFLDKAPEEKGELTESSLSDILVIQYKDSFWGNSIPFSFSVIFEAEEPKNFYQVRGGEESEKFYGNYILWPKLGWDFQNGFQIEFSYVGIRGKNETILSYYNDNDYVGFKMQYVY